MTRPLALFALATLAACAPQSRELVAREAAKAAIRPVLQQRLPGVPLEPAVGCIIDNATADEIVTLAAQATVARDNAGAARTVTQIASRPETFRCIAEVGLPALLGGIGG